MNQNVDPIQSGQINNTKQVNMEQMQNESQMNQTQPINVQPQYIAVQKDVIPEEYKPISMWGYFGYELLFSIPLIGFILILVFSFGGARNINLRNFARSYFCALIIVLILGSFIFAMIMIFGGAASLSGIGTGAMESSKTIY